MAELVMHGCHQVSTSTSYVCDSFCLFMEIIMIPSTGPECIWNLINTLCCSPPISSETMEVKMPAMHKILEWNWYVFDLNSPSSWWISLLPLITMLLCLLPQNWMKTNWFYLSGMLWKCQAFCQYKESHFPPNFMFTPSGFFPPSYFGTVMFCLKYWYGLARHDDRDFFALFHCQLLQLVEFCTCTECLAWSPKTGCYPSPEWNRVNY